LKISHTSIFDVDSAKEDFEENSNFKDTIFPIFWPGSKEVRRYCWRLEFSAEFSSYAT